MKKLTAATTTLAALLLSACGPSQPDIEQALKASLQPSNNALTGVFGNAAQIELKDVKKLGCEKSSAAGYKCDVEWTVIVPVLGESKKQGSVNLIKGSDGKWQVAG